MGGCFPNCKLSLLPSDKSTVGARPCIGCRYCYLVDWIKGHKFSADFSPRRPCFSSRPAVQFSSVQDSSVIFWCTLYRNQTSCPVKLPVVVCALSFSDRTWSCGCSKVVRYVRDLISFLLFSTGVIMVMMTVVWCGGIAITATVQHSLLLEHCRLHPLAVNGCQHSHVTQSIACLCYGFI